jgi:OPA family glycerol-6-phosphate transporter-like MFS transporter 4
VTCFEVAGIFSSLFSGSITDYRISKKKSKPKDNKSARMPLLIFYVVLLALSLHMFIYHVDNKTSYYKTLAIGFAGGFSSYGPITLLGVMAMEFTPKALSGTSHSLVTLAANLGAVCAGLPFSYLSKSYSWKAALLAVQLPVIFTLLCLCGFRNFNSKFVILNTENKEKYQ